MRYQNWDVLLFPANSPVPIQEFRTACYAIKDPDIVETPNGLMAPSEYPIFADVPIVTTFIPALPSGHNFKISIHSWQNPLPSQRLNDRLHGKEDVLFESRVLLDGCFMSDLHFPKTGPWPQSIEWSNGDTTRSPAPLIVELIRDMLERDQGGHREALAFSPFHREVMDRDWWNAAEDLNRIKVVIAEGMPREGLQPPFERFRNIVVFAFQHVPLDILEASCIAWPNPSMWHPTPLPIIPARASTGGQPVAGRRSHIPAPMQEDVDQQARTAMGPPQLPLRESFHDGLTQSSRYFPPESLATSWLDSYQRIMLGDASEAFPQFRDTRLSSTHWSAEDVPMPDYSRSATTASSRSATGIPNNKSTGMANSSTDQSKQNSSQEPKTHQSGKRGKSGTMAPANTPVKPVATPLNHPSATSPKPAQLALSSFPRRASQHPKETTQIAKPFTGARVTSDVSMKSRSSDGADIYPDKPSSIIEGRPGRTVKGRKEGKEDRARARDGSEGTSTKQPEDNSPKKLRKENVASRRATSSANGSKRKRGTLATPEQAVDHDCALKDDPRSSPARKVSRGEAQNASPVQIPSGLNDETAKLPLDNIENTH
ncbi:MAG: hypothetical protein M1833_005616 [Piccolia ochrophora]|nr:MAG: hypothetical protein M1833_005616 [Piccolia ochrophora]